MKRKCNFQLSDAIKGNRLVSSKVLQEFAQGLPTCLISKRWCHREGNAYDQLGVLGVESVLLELAVRHDQR